jgi:hypothetical protein
VKPVLGLLILFLCALPVSAQEGDLVCESFSHAGSKAFAVGDLTDTTVLPWGAIDFAMVVAMISDRADFDPDDLAGGNRTSGPELVSFGGFDWVAAEYSFEAADKSFAINLLLWLEKSRVMGLRCSHSDDADFSEQIHDSALELRR